MGDETEITKREQETHIQYQTKQKGVVISLSVWKEGSISKNVEGMIELAIEMVSRLIEREDERNGSIVHSGKHRSGEADRA